MSRLRRGAVIVGGYVNGLGLVRALTARGIPTAVVTTAPFDIAHRSRHAHSRDAAPDLQTRPSQLVEVLERRAREWAGWAVFPTNDASLWALAEAHERLSATYRLIAPPAEVARQFIDKRLMHAAADATGLTTPRLYGPADEATAAMPEIEFPVVVKPAVTFPFTTQFGAKLLVAESREELTRCVARMGGSGIEGLVYDRVPGEDDAVYAHCVHLGENGDPLGALTVHKLRQNPPGYGDARVAEIVATVPELHEATVELLRAMGHRGHAGAEFKRDARDGSWRFIEVNGRSLVYNGLMRRAGFDTAGVAWADQVEGHPERARPNGWPGAWIHLHPDLLYSLLRRREHPVGLRAFLAPYRGPAIEAVWSARDPAPFAAQWARTAGEGAAALARGRYTDRVAAGR